MFPYNTDIPGLNKQANDLLQSFQKNMCVSAERHTVKVNGRAGAEAYQLPPNSDEILIDLNDSIIWFVQTDGAGYKTVTPYDISEHKEIKQEDIIKSLNDRITKLEEEMRNGKLNSSANGEGSTTYSSGKQYKDAGNRSNAQG